MYWCLLYVLYTLPETNIAPENGPSQRETSIPTIHFQVRTVSFRDCNPFHPFTLMVRIINGSPLAVFESSYQELLKQHQENVEQLQLIDKREEAGKFKQNITPKTRGGGLKNDSNSTCNIYTGIN